MGNINKSSQRKLELCGVVILYYPQYEQTIHNIKLYLSDIEHLIIWDNTPKSEQDTRYAALSESSSKITYLSTGNNEGIATALNRAAQWAYDHGFTHLLTMDQDSEWENFNYYRTEFNNINSDKIAAYAPLIYDIRRDIIGFNSKNQIITSGAIYNIKILKDLGGFCEEFIIDNVDTEYSFRIRLSQYEIKLIPNAILKQTFGHIKKVPILGCYHGHYSAFRLYHILRNNIWMWRMYRNTDVLPKRFLSFNIYTYLVREPILILFSGNNKISKVKALFRGLNDGIFKYPKSLNYLINKI